jgi:hypothetical protein
MDQGNTNQQEKTQKHCKSCSVWLLPNGRHILSEYICRRTSSSLAKSTPEIRKFVPATSHRDELVYSIETKMKTDYVLEVYIDARFVDDSLTRLHVSWSAQN